MVCLEGPTTLLRVLERWCLKWLHCNGVTSLGGFMEGTFFSAGQGIAMRMARIHSCYFKRQQHRIRNSDVHPKRRSLSLCQKDGLNANFDFHIVDTVPLEVVIVPASNVLGYRH